VLYTTRFANRLRFKHAHKPSKETLDKTALKQGEIQHELKDALGNDAWSWELKPYPLEISSSLLWAMSCSILASLSNLDNNYTKEEMKLVNETHKILDPNIRVTATA